MEMRDINSGIIEHPDILETRGGDMLYVLPYPATSPFSKVGGWRAVDGNDTVRVTSDDYNDNFIHHFALNSPLDIIAVHRNGIRIPLGFDIYGTVYLRIRTPDGERIDREVTVSEGTFNKIKALIGWQ